MSLSIRAKAPQAFIALLTDENMNESFSTHKYGQKTWKNLKTSSKKIRVKVVIGTITVLAQRMKPQESTPLMRRHHTTADLRTPHTFQSPQSNISKQLRWLPGLSNPDKRSCLPRSILPTFKILARITYNPVRMRNQQVVSKTVTIEEWRNLRTNKSLGGTLSRSSRQLSTPHTKCRGSSSQQKIHGSTTEALRRSATLKLWRSLYSMSKIIKIFSCFLFRAAHAAELPARLSGNSQRVEQYQHKSQKRLASHTFKKLPKACLLLLSATTKNLKKCINPAR